MNLCKTCKHWKGQGKVITNHVVNDVINPVEWETGKPMVMPFEIRECRHPSKTFCEQPVEENGFGVCDGSTYMAALITGPEFGCVRHEEDK